MAKRVKAIIKLQISAGKATAAPPVGPAVGAYLNVMQFVKEYNERTASQVGSIVPVEITVFEDRSFTFITKTPPAADLIRKTLGIDKGSPTPNKTKVGKLSPEQVRQIAQTKLADLNANDLVAAEKMITGTARSMGIEVG